MPTTLFFFFQMRATSAGEKADIKSLHQEANLTIFFPETIFCCQLKFSEGIVIMGPKQLIHSYYSFYKTTGYCMSRKFTVSSRLWPTSLRRSSVSSVTSACLLWETGEEGLPSRPQLCLHSGHVLSPASMAISHCLSFNTASRSP